METPAPVGAVVAGRVRALRDDQRLSVRELAAALTEAGHKIIPSGVSKIENGDRGISVSDLLAMAVALKTTPSALLVDLNREAVAVTDTLVVRPADLLWWLWDEEPLPDSVGAHHDRETSQAARLLRELLWTWRTSRVAEHALAEYRSADPALLRKAAERATQHTGQTPDEYQAQQAAEREGQAEIARRQLLAIASELQTLNVAPPTAVAEYLERQ